MSLICKTAPHNKLLLLHELERYMKTHEAVEKAAIKSFSTHVIEILIVGLAFFDSPLSAEMMSAMVTCSA